ncbi:2-hydroxyacid dehydrogenase [Thermocrispum sp.]|uniref:2-hydroxyacid dehydrogenase n=2 Tax=Thermocrispum agreste TaxID=37925 RepID=A0ABD6FJF1_9PSEU|nr:2-hydroxyacid dehydrogenase [Thermocrispum sp.]
MSSGDHHASSSGGRVLAVGPLPPWLQAVVDKHDPLVLPGGAEREAFLAEHAASVHVAVTTSFTGVGSELMAALPNLRAVINFGTGCDSTDLAQAERRGIGVSNTPDVLTDCVADTAVALLLDALRGFAAADRYVRQGRWETEGPFRLTRKVGGTRVGILGLGRIGRAVAARLEPFGCRIAYHNRRRVADVGYPYYDSPVALAEAVDVLVVAVTGGPETARLVDRSVLTALGPDGYLVNVSRGSVIDEEALVELLATGGLAGAGLDVYTNEPHVPERLRELDNVMLLPHVGSGTVETRKAMSDIAAANLEQFLKDGTLLNPVVEPAETN